MVWTVLLICVLSAPISPAHAKRVQSKPLQFAKGTSSATVTDSLAGDETVDYALRARAGQTMRVTLKTTNDANYFNVLPPASNDVAIFIGSTEGNEFTGVLPADGEYKIRVYLMRSAARRNEKADYTLTVGITGAATGDAKVSGTSYHATGKVPCSMGDAAPGSAQCEFGVIRRGSGDAEVHVKPAGGFQRMLKFAGGTVTSDGDAAVKASKSGDTWSVEVNDYEHYQIPEAVISGG
jgi:hypothetical protein